MKFSLKGVVTAIGATVAIITAVSLPAAYFFAGYTSLSDRLAFEAELNAGYLARYINSHATLGNFKMFVSPNCSARPMPPIPNSKSAWWIPPMELYSTRVIRRPHLLWRAGSLSRSPGPLWPMSNSKRA